jgi:hypothetical protein
MAFDVSFTSHDEGLPQTHQKGYRHHSNCKVWHEAYLGTNQNKPREVLKIAANAIDAATDILAKQVAIKAVCNNITP